MSAPSPVDAPQHILDLLSDLHQKSLKQEAAMSSAKKGKVFSTEVLGDLKDQKPSGSPQNEFDQLMRDKFIALDEDKCQFTYQLITRWGPRISSRQGPASESSISTLLCPTDHSSTLRETKKIPNGNGQLPQRSKPLDCFIHMANSPQDGKGCGPML